MSTASTTRTRTVAARPRRLVSLFSLILLVAVALQLLNPAFRAALDPAIPPSANAGASSYPFTEVNPYGATTFLSKEVEDWKRDKTLQMMSDAGLGWVKQQFPWSEIEPKRGRFWDDKYNQNSWDKYDRIVALSEKHGLRIIARLDNTPDWARGPRTNNQTPPTDPEAYANFVATFVEHYKGRIQYLQIWNEPNLKAEWGGRLDAAAYVDLLRRAYARAKAVDPNIVILSAPLAQTLEEGDRGLNELVYLQQLYDAGLRGNFDIMLANGYGFDLPPEAPPDPRVLNLRRVELLREVMERNGDASKPIWLNEYGWNAAPADFPSDRLTWRRVTPDQQAAYTLEGIRYARQHWPWIGVINIWFFRQVGDIPPDDPTYYFRIVELEFATTPLYRELQRAALEQRRALPGRYGPLSPPLANRGRWTTVQRPQPGGAGPPVLYSNHLYDQLTIQFQGNRLTLEGLRGPQGGRLGVTIDDSTAAVRHLPQDERGRRYVDFQAETAGVTSVTVVSGLDPIGQPREHRAVLTVLPKGEGQGAGEILLTAVEVSYSRSPLPFAIVTTVAVLLLVGLGTLAARVAGRLRGARAGGRRNG